MEALEQSNAAAAWGATWQDAKHALSVGERVEVRAGGGDDWTATE